MAKRPVQTYTLKVKGRCASRYLVYYHTFKMEIYNKHLTQINTHGDKNHAMSGSSLAWLWLWAKFYSRVAAAPC